MGLRFREECNGGGSQALRGGNEVGREGLGPRIREDNGGEGRWVPAPVFMGRAGATEVGRRWVPASDRDDGPLSSCGSAQGQRSGEEMGRRTTEGRDDGFPPLSSWALRGGQRSGEEMGPRIREDNGGERRWIPAPVFMGRLCAGATKWGGDGSPHPRGQRRGETMGSRPCLHGQALRGGNGGGRRWVPASARNNGGARGQERMGPRIRGDNGGGAGR